MNTTPTPAPASPELMTIFGRTKGYLLTEKTAYSAVDALADIARDVISAAQGAGVSVISVDGKRSSVGATDQSVLNADTLQYDLGEGPCLSAWATGSPAYLPDTHTDEHWTHWSLAAAANGIRSCLSVPLLTSPAGIGAMKIYSTVPDAFTAQDRQLLVNLARSAAVLLGHIQAPDTPQRISDAVKNTLTERDTVSTARGILMERLDLDQHAAMHHLSRLAQDAGMTIGAMAATINERQDLTPLSGDE